MFPLNILLSTFSSIKFHLIIHDSVNDEAVQCVLIRRSSFAGMLRKNKIHPCNLLNEVSIRLLVSLGEIA